MTNRNFAGFALLIMILFLTGCMEEKRKSDIYILEEFETASSIELPAKRIKRLKMFLNNHPDHMCRKFAYERIFDSLAEDIGKRDEAMEFLDKSIQAEDHPEVKGSLCFRKFTYLWSVDSTAAVEYATELFESDNSIFRLFVYLGFELDYNGRFEMAGKMFKKAMAVGNNSYEKSFAGVLYGEFLSRRGKDELAFEILKESRDNAFSGKQLGKIQWETGEREEALEAYINLAAVVPREHSEVKLDSLYEIVYPGKNSELEDKILKRRISDRELLQEARFFDAEGRYFNLADYRGSKLVISVWNPT